jgi:hypothetical protein
VEPGLGVGFWEITSPNSVHAVTNDVHGAIAGGDSALHPFIKEINWFDLDHIFSSILGIVAYLFFTYIQTLLREFIAKRLTKHTVGKSENTTEGERP